MICGGRRGMFGGGGGGIEELKIKAIKRGMRGRGVIGGRRS
jgi:hypothetical protein